MNNKESKTIIFYPWGHNDDFYPVTAKRTIAPYWKDLPLFHGEDDEKKFKNGEANRKNTYLSLKHCMPYFDAMTMAYHYVLHTDVYVLRKDDGSPEVKWEDSRHPISPRGLQEMPTPHGHYQAHYSWQMYWGIETPEGWGALLLHPINRYDLPFTTVAGYVDYDLYPMPGNVSFHIKDNFEGVIPKGTPIMSIIPIPRINWESKIDTTPDFFNKKLALSQEKETVPMAHYKKGYRLGLDYK